MSQATGGQEPPRRRREPAVECRPAGGEPRCSKNSLRACLTSPRAARSGGDLKKCLASYKKVDLLVLDEWLIRPLSPQESYDLLEIVEARCQRSMIFCTQYQSESLFNIF